MFDPRYSISDHLLSNITRVNTLVNDLNNKRFPSVVLLELEKSAREISSYTSTRIEGNPLPLTEVKKILKSKPQHLRDSEREVINYNQALLGLNKKIDEQGVALSLKLILKIHGRVTDGLLPSFESGKLRKKAVFVNDPRSDNQVVYMPPDVKDIKPLMENLISFINDKKDSIDPLVLAGIFHKQMVIIHPFTDGNGRTTRIATKVLLAHMGLNTFNLFSFENYYNKNITKYFQNVGEYGNYYDLKANIDYTHWLEYFTEGIIDELLRITGLLPSVGATPATNLESYHLKILNFIKKKGFITSRDYEKLVKRARATRALDFQKLIELGMIEKRGKGKATYYILKEES